jgi:heptosyltransferase-1
LKILIIKTSSLGDVIHTFPAVTDAANAIPGVRFDWVVEEAFQEVPGWHPAVERVIPVAVRRWRKGWLAARRSGEIAAFRKQLAEESYDLIIDAQGLIKSALIARMAQGERAGLDRHSAREPLAAVGYQRKISVARKMHAIERVRSLFAQALNYSLPDGAPDYGIDLSPASESEPPYLLFLHGTTWTTKLWPEQYWKELAQLADSAGYEVRLPWGSETERERAEWIASVVPAARQLPRLGLSQLKDQLSGAAGVVGVDSGLAHLAAALSRPAVTLYGPTRTDLTGALGRNQINLKADFSCAPCMRKTCDYRGEAAVQPACFETLPPQRVWQQLQVQMEGAA